MDMGGKKLFVKSIHCSVYCGGLDQDVIAVGIVFQHSYNTPHLSFNSFQPVDKLFPVFLRTYWWVDLVQQQDVVSVTVNSSFDSFMAKYASCLLKHTPYGYVFV